MLLCAQYVLPISGDVIRNGAVLVRDGRIADIGPASSLKIRYTDVPSTDYGQAVLMPGLVDLHTHLEYTAFRGLQHDLPYMEWSAACARNASRLKTQDWDVAAVNGGLEALAMGVTCVADVTSTGASMRAAQNLGLRGVFFREAGAMDKRRIDHAMEHAAEDVLEWRESVDSGRISVGVAAAQLYECHPAVFGRVADLAREFDAPMALHLASSREEYNFVKYGSSGFSVHNDHYRGFVEMPPWLPSGESPVRYAYNWGAFDAPQVLAIHCVHVDDEDIAILKKHDVAVAVCARSNAQLGKGVAPLREFLRMGLRVGLGTDSPAATDSIDMFMEQRVAMLLERAINGQDFLGSSALLRMATLGGAEALGLQDEIGSLEVGKRADIIAVSLAGTMQSEDVDPAAQVVNTRSGADVVMTMVDGMKRYEKDQWHVGVDVVRAIAQLIGVRSKLR